MSFTKLGSQDIPTTPAVPIQIERSAALRNVVHVHGCIQHGTIQIICIYFYFWGNYYGTKQNALYVACWGLLSEKVKDRTYLTLE